MTSNAALLGHPRPGRKPAWMLGFGIYKNKKKYSYYLIYIFIETPPKHPVAFEICPCC
jgi:hypothetical protein